jgi:cell wall-associated NlpC family hydrolase
MMRTFQIKDTTRRRGYLIIAACSALLLILSGCGGRTAAPLKQPVVERDTPAQAALMKVGYTIQAGAFARVENAANLSENLRRRSLDATYFLDADGLYKVRFGNFTGRDEARNRADALRKAGVIDAFYIVSPDQYAVAREQMYGTSYVRTEIVKTARSFLGVPYLWGGTSAETGFDCSGLTVASYKLNGLTLPRSAREQFTLGSAVNRESLFPGDLVFFANGREEITHVGIYVGGDRFIHAPGQGRNIREDSLSGSGGYYEKRFRGGRSYL